MVNPSSIDKIAPLAGATIAGADFNLEDNDNTKLHEVRQAPEGSNVGEYIQI